MKAPSSRSSVSDSVGRRAKDLLVLVLLALFIAPVAVAQRTDVTERLLYKLENDFAAAVVRRDAKALYKLTSPRWVYSDESGVMGQAAGIKTFTAGPDTVKEATNEDMRAFVYGKTAVVIGILRLKGRGPKGPFDNRYRYTDTWMQIDGRWQCIAAQDYLMPAAKR
jgi:ketosteroid isomerase-like protein